MTALYYNANGGFRAEFLDVKYPDFAAPVLCESMPCAARDEAPLSATERGNVIADKGRRHDDKAPSAQQNLGGGRSKSDFAGGGVVANKPPAHYRTDEASNNTPAATPSSNSALRQMNGSPDGAINASRNSEQQAAGLPQSKGRW